jgi:hypothetical protein
LERMRQAYFAHMEADLREKGLYGRSTGDRRSLSQP